jgi:hypothetical protein
MRARYADTHRRETANILPTTTRTNAVIISTRSARDLPGVFLYAFGFILALFSTYAAVAWWGLLALFYLLPPSE